PDRPVGSAISRSRRDPDRVRRASDRERRAHLRRSRTCAASPAAGLTRRHQPGRTEPMALPHDGTETELKFRVSDDRAFTALAAAAGRPLPSPAVQVNHFLDTPDFRLSAARYAVRLREEEGSFVLCAKGPEQI